MDYAKNIRPTAVKGTSYVKLRQSQSMFVTPTNRYEIRKIILSLPNKTSCGLDGVSNILLKLISEEISIPLEVIFQLSLTEGVFPNSMKAAKIFPLYTSKERYFLNNYRPISLLITLSKCLEKLMHVRYANFFETYDIFNSRQYGFRKKKSTIHAILDLVGTIIKEHEAGNFTGAIFIDLSKAFDTITYKTFYKKLEQYGVRGNALQWMKSYLTGRSHKVMLGDIISKNFEIKIGCPQGSIMGPLCYIIFVNCIFNTICDPKCTLISYADDMTLLYSSHALMDIHSKLQQYLSELMLYFKANGLSINLGKTELVLFNLNKPIPVDFPALRIGDTTIKRSETFKFLGVILDKDLNWHAHVTNLHTKLTSASFILNAVKRKIGRGNVRNLYYALYYSHLTYGIQAWGPMISKQNFKYLKTNQNKLVRRICEVNQVCCVISD